MQSQPITSTSVPTGIIIMSRIAIEAGACAGAVRESEGGRAPADRDPVVVDMT